MMSSSRKLKQPPQPCSHPTTNILEEWTFIEGTAKLRFLDQLPSQQYLGLAE